MLLMMQARELDAELQAWVEATAGGRIVALERAGVGGSRELYFLDVEQPDGATRSLVLRYEAGGSFTGTEISPAKEAVVYRALERTAVPVPRVLGLAPGDAALLMERVHGRSDISDLDAEQRAATMVSFVDALAALHNLDIHALELPGFARPATAEEHARLDLELWAKLATDGVDDLDPLVHYAGAWLHAHAPTSVSRTVLVQGDTGPGNFVFDGTAITGIVDWEFAHIGDPMDDWAWLDMRARGADLGDLHDRYTQWSGIPIDHERIRYYRAAVDYRCAITTSLAVSRGGGARGWAPYLLVTQRYLADLAARMSQLLGITETVDLPELAPTPRTASFDALVDGIRAAVREIDDADARERTRNLQIFVHYLRAYDAVGLDLDRADLDDRTSTLGSAARDEGCFADLVTAAGVDGDETLFRYLLRRAARRRVLWSSLLDRPPR
jgi:aminoglycoside phosphotransferase (APT) family kinase protein